MSNNKDYSREFWELPGNNPNVVSIDSKVVQNLHGLIMLGGVSTRVELYDPEYCAKIEVVFDFFHGDNYRRAVQFVNKRFPNK